LRDKAVIEAVRGRGAPLCIVLAGGYAASRARTAELHAHAFREAVAYERVNGVPRRHRAG
jgi:acetoin utilization deacetylase AcuC-like enzyme